MDLLAAYGSDSEDEPCTFPALSSRKDGSDPSPKRIKLDPDRAGLSSTAHSLPDPAALLDGPIPSTQHLQPTAAILAASGGKLPQHVNPSGTHPVVAAGQPPEPPRVRIFPHVEGNFPTVTYIAVPDKLHQQLQALTSSLVAQCPAATAQGALGATAGAGAAAAAAGAAAVTAPASAHRDLRPAASSGTASTAQLLCLWPTFACSTHTQQQQQKLDQEQREQQVPLHMSVSRTVPIRHGQIASLKAALAKQLKGFRSFKVQLQGLSCLVNDNGSRSFVGVGVAAGHQQVVRLIEAVNRAFIIHGLQPFYEDPRPHVSLAWTPGDQVARLQPWLDNFQHTAITMQVSQVVCQVGKTKHVVWEA